MSQTNAIALGAILGQYGSALFMGAFADKSARLSSLLASVLFASGYTMMAISLSRSIPPTYAFFVGYFVLAGSGTVASYFAALTASAKSFPDHPGLAIGVPSALFGISPLLLSSIGSALFTIQEGDNAGDIDAVGLFAFFAGLNGIVNLFSACFIKPIILPEPEEKIINDSAIQEPGETQPLLPTTFVHPPHQNVICFLKQSSPWIFVAIVLLVKWALVRSSCRSDTGRTADMSCIPQRSMRSHLAELRLLKRGTHSSKHDKLAGPRDTHITQKTDTSLQRGQHSHTAALRRSE